jgi:hypothetical protein
VRRSFGLRLCLQPVQPRLVIQAGSVVRMKGAQSADYGRTSYAFVLHVEERF